MASSPHIPSSFLMPSMMRTTVREEGPAATSELRVAAADSWLSNNLPQLLSNPQFQQSGILVVTTDESRDDITDGGGKVATVIVGTGVKAGYIGSVMYDHRSLLGLSMTALGVSTIPNDAGSANQMTEFFQ